MQPITITADMANSIWAYLSARRFDEVANLAIAFQQMVGPQIPALEQANTGVTEAPVEEQVD